MCDLAGVVLPATSSAAALSLSWQCLLEGEAGAKVLLLIGIDYLS
mgnify:CR=1 FL=1